MCNKNTLANSVDPDERVHYEQFHLDLPTIHLYLRWYAGLKRVYKDIIMFV